MELIFDGVSDRFTQLLCVDWLPNAPINTNTDVRAQVQRSELGGHDENLRQGRYRIIIVALQPPPRTGLFHLLSSFLLVGVPTSKPLGDFNGVVRRQILGEQKNIKRRGRCLQYVDALFPIRRCPHDIVICPKVLGDRQHRLLIAIGDENPRSLCAASLLLVPTMKWFLLRLLELLRFGCR